MAAFDSRTIGRLTRSALSAHAFRNQPRGFDPRSGEGARRQGGRFNPPRSFPVLYLCLSRPCVVAELSRQAARQSLTVDDLLPRELWQFTIELTGVLDLTDAAVLAALELAEPDLVRDDVEVTREIGEAAHEQGFQAIKSISATGIDEIVAVFPENLAGAALEIDLVAEWTTPEDLPW